MTPHPLEGMLGEILVTSTGLTCEHHMDIQSIPDQILFLLAKERKKGHFFLDIRSYPKGMF
jgi:hypothetical protein